MIWWLEQHFIPKSFLYLCVKGCMWMTSDGCFFLCCSICVFLICCLNIHNGFCTFKLCLVTENQRNLKGSYEHAIEMILCWHKLTHYLSKSVKQRSKTFVLFLNYYDWKNLQSSVYNHRNMFIFLFILSTNMNLFAASAPEMLK